MDKNQSNTENYLNTLLKGFDEAEKETNVFEIEYSGERHSETLKDLAAAVSLVYRAACCFWQCNGGDHVVERLIAKSVNQTICALKLYKGCFYDESLMISRGIGETVNLLYLFYFFPEKLNEWKTLDGKDRYRHFKPSSVRQSLEAAQKVVPIDKTRYAKLCEIGTHPSPAEVPGHYSGTGIPVLGMVVQPVGAFVSITELSYPVGLLCAVTPKLLKLNVDLSKEFKSIGISLIKNLGAFNILNYQELLAGHLAKKK